MVKQFLPMATLSPDTAHYQIFETFNPFTFRLTNEAWERILNEYIQSGLLDATFGSPREL